MNETCSSSSKVEASRASAPNGQTQWSRFPESQHTTIKHARYALFAVLLAVFLLTPACSAQSKIVPLRDSWIAESFLVPSPTATPQPTAAPRRLMPTFTPHPSSTPSPVPTRTPTPTPPPPTPTPIRYTVQEGDTPAAIAARYGVTVEALLAANPDVEPTRLQVGQTLIIPGPETLAVRPPSTPTPSPAEPTSTPGPGTPTATAEATGGGGLVDSTPIVIKVPEVGDSATIHYVQEGETLSQIAEQYGITVGDLLAANGLSPDVQLIAGEPLVIPKGVVTPAPTRTPTPQPVAEVPTPTPISLTGLTFAREAENTPERRTPTPVPPTPTPIVYEVQRGDTPQRIADRFGISVDDLLAANPGLNPRALQIGQKVIIPPKTGSGQPVYTPTPTPVIVYTQHTVQQGETLASIAEAYGISLTDLVNANSQKLTPEGGVEPGMVLRVPLGTPTPTATPTPFPTFTPTPAPPYPAPVLLQPRRYALISGTKTPLLMWTSSGVLQEDEYYAVRVRFLEEDDVVYTEYFRTKGTSLRLPEELRPPQMMLVRWDVLVIRMLTDEIVGEALSPLSQTGEFYWGP